MKRNASIVAKVLAPIAAVLTVFGGMAYAGALPRSVQNAVSHAAGNVGVTLPGDEDTQELPGENDDHQGMIFTSDRRFPRDDPRIIGRIVNALDASGFRVELLR